MSNPLSLEESHVTLYMFDVLPTKCSHHFFRVKMTLIFDFASVRIFKTLSLH